MHVQSLKIACLLALASLIQCFRPDTQTNPNSLNVIKQQSQSATTETSIQKESRNNSYITSQKRYSNSPACSLESENSQCKLICQDIYDRAYDSKNCEKLSIAQIKELDRIHSTLQKPRLQDVKSINLEDFKVYIRTSINPFYKLILKYDHRTIKDVMIWFMEQDAFLKVFDDEKARNRLLSRYVNQYRRQQDFAFAQNIKGTNKIMHKSLIEFAASINSEEVWIWLRNFIENNRCDNYDVSVKTRCFKLYCDIGKRIGPDAREDWLNSDKDFVYYLDDIIKDGINSGYRGWSRNFYDDIDDVRDWLQLCKGL